MIAAIYARKSTEQNGVPDDQKSVARQVEHARAYAVRKGWTVDDAYTFVDDGISGAEFANRPGFLRLMNVLKPRPPFQVLVMSEESRLGREAIETAYALKQLVTGGVRVFFYLEDRERTLDSPTDKIMLSLTAFADELEREKARQRTYDAMARKARAGHVTGGRVFGYNNVEVQTPDGRRSHVERRINEGEAAIVRRIFDLCAGGKGMKAIAKTLNADRVPAPRAQQGRPTGWAPSSVREVLYRPLYRGEIVWNKTQKRDAWGQKTYRERQASAWLSVDASALRIVVEDVWTAAHERLAAGRAIYLRGSNGHLWGRPAHGSESKYLLTGLARCASCGGTLTVRSRSHGKRRAYFYACSSFHHRGQAVCANSLEMRLEDADQAVLTAIERDLLNEDLVREGMELALVQAEHLGEDLATRRAVIRKALAQTSEELERLTGAVLAGGEVATLVQAMRDRERRRVELERELEEVSHIRPARIDAGRVRLALREKLTEWRALLHKHAPVSRQMLRKLITDRIVFTPDRAARRYTFLAPGSLVKFFSGLVCPQGMASPTGFEPVFWP